MTEEAIDTKNYELNYGIKWSLSAHLVLALLILIKGTFFMGKPMRYIPTLKVDLVGLPDLLKNEVTRPKTSSFNSEISKVLKQAEADAKRIKSSAPIQDTAKRDEMVHRPHPVAPSNSIEKRNRKALERLKSLAKVQDTAEVENASAPKHLPIKGNKVSPGASLSGDAREASEANYLELLQDRLHENFFLPPWIARQNLDAQVRIYIDAKGRLQTFKFTKTSGNLQFDESVKKALQESQPFPSPPQEFASRLIDIGVLIGFPL